MNQELTQNLGNPVDNNSDLIMQPVGNYISINSASPYGYPYSDVIPSSLNHNNGQYPQIDFQQIDNNNNNNSNNYSDPSMYMNYMNNNVRPNNYNNNQMGRTQQQGGYNRNQGQQNVYYSNAPYANRNVQGNNRYQNQFHIPNNNVFNNQPHFNQMNNQRQNNISKLKHNESPLLVDENEFEDTLSQACIKGKLLFIQQIETILETFIAQPDEQTIIQDLDQFERKILHKICERYGLKRPLEDNKGNITVEKTEFTRIPSKKVADLFNEQETVDNSNQSQKTPQNRPTKILNKGSYSQNQDYSEISQNRQNEQMLENMKLTDEQMQNQMQKKEQYFNKKNELFNKTNPNDNIQKDQSSQLNTFTDTQTHDNNHSRNNNSSRNSQNHNPTNFNPNNNINYTDTHNFNPPPPHHLEPSTHSQDDEDDTTASEFSRKEFLNNNNNNNSKRNPHQHKNYYKMSSNAQFPENHQNDPSLQNFIDPQFYQQMNKQQQNYPIVNERQIDPSQIPNIHNKNRHFNHINNPNGYINNNNSYNPASLHNNHSNNNNHNNNNNNNNNNRRNNNNYTNQIERQNNSNQNNYVNHTNPNYNNNFNQQGRQGNNNNSNSNNNNNNNNYHQNYQNNNYLKHPYINTDGQQLFIPDEYNASALQSQQQLARERIPSGNKLVQQNTVFPLVDADLQAVSVPVQKTIEQLSCEIKKLEDTKGQYQALIQDAVDEKDFQRKNAIFAANNNYTKKIQEITKQVELLLNQIEEIKKEEEDRILFEQEQLLQQQSNQRQKNTQNTNYNNNRRNNNQNQTNNGNNRNNQNNQNRMQNTNYPNNQGQSNNNNNNNNNNNQGYNQRTSDNSGQQNHTQNNQGQFKQNRNEVFFQSQFSNDDASFPSLK